MSVDYAAIDSVNSSLFSTKYYICPDCGVFTRWFDNQCPVCLPEDPPPALRVTVGRKGTHLLVATEDGENYRCIPKSSDAMAAAATLRSLPEKPTWQ